MDYLSMLLAVSAICALLMVVIIWLCVVIVTQRDALDVMGMELHCVRARSK